MVKFRITQSSCGKSSAPAAASHQVAKDHTLWGLYYTLLVISILVLSYDCHCIEMHISWYSKKVLFSHCNAKVSDILHCIGATFAVSNNHACPDWMGS